MPFQQRQMLVGGSVNDDTGSGGIKDLPDASTVADVSDDHIGAVEERFAVELELQGMQIRFVVVQHVKRSWIAAADLAAELLPDGPPSSGHQNTFPRERSASGSVGNSGAPGGRAGC